MDDKKLSDDDVVIFELTCFILAFISGLFTVYSVLRYSPFMSQIH